MVIGAWIALFKDDLKGLLAHSTVSHLGLVTMLFGFGTPLAAVAGVFHILNHATFKCALFMTAGIVDHEAGTRDARRLGGLATLLPSTATIPPPAGPLGTQAWRERGCPFGYVPGAAPSLTKNQPNTK